MTNRWRFSNGKYQWEAQAHKGVHWYVYPDVKAVSDFYLTVQAQQASGPEDSNHGVVFRVIGEYQLTIQSPEGKWFTIMASGVPVAESFTVAEGKTTSVGRVIIGE